MTFCFRTSAFAVHYVNLNSFFFLQGQQLMDLEQKLTVAKEELEKTALDKVSHWGRGFTFERRLQRQRRYLRRIGAKEGRSFNLICRSRT